jgi:hypothetical protein
MFPCYVGKAILKNCPLDSRWDMGLWFLPEWLFYPHTRRLFLCSSTNGDGHRSARNISQGRKSRTKEEIHSSEWVWSTKNTHYLSLTKLNAKIYKKCFKKLDIR